MTISGADNAGAELDAALEDDQADESTMDVEDQPANAADSEAISLQAVRSKRIKSRTARFYRAILATPEWRAEFMRILRMGNLFGAPFASVGGFPDPHATFFGAGKQALVQSIYHEAMAADIDGVREMLKEHDPGFAALAPELKQRGARA